MSGVPDPAHNAGLPAEAAASPVVVLVRDLILGSRVSAAAARLGVPIRSLRDPTALADAAGDRLIVDLNLDGAIAAATAWRSAAAGRTVVGFVSHVDAETTRHAREQGIDRVLARSRFVEILPELLAGGGSG